MSFLGWWGSGMLSVVTKRKSDTLAIRKQEHSTFFSRLIYSGEERG